MRERDTFLSQLLGSRRGSIRYLFIELTNHCNFSCTFCPDGQMKRTRGFLDRETVRRIIREVGKKKLTREPLQFHLMGEPLLSKDLFEHIEYAHKFSLKVRLLTNGALLSDKVVTRLFSLGVEELVIGIQTHGEDSFNANRRGRIAYGDYMKGIREAVAAKFRSAAATRIYLHYLNTQEFNRARVEQGYPPVFSPELVDSDEQALAVVAEWKAFGEALSDEHNLNFKPRDLECLLGEYADRPLSCLFGDHAEILPGVILGFKGISPFSDWLLKDVRYVERHRGTCSSLYEQLAILSDGRATLCCVDYEGQLAVGRITDTDVDALYHSQAARMLRETMKKGIFPHRLCRICKAFIVRDDYALGFGQPMKGLSLGDGFYSLENDGQRFFRWMGKTARLRVKGAGSLELDFKKGGPGEQPCTLIIRQGGLERRYSISGTEWTRIDFPLQEGAERGADVELEAENFFIPSELDIASSDARELALMCSAFDSLP